MNRVLPLLIVSFVFIAAGFTTAEPANWTDDIAGTYKGEVGSNKDAIVIEFTHPDGKLAATYTIDDPQFDSKPYKGKLMKFTPTADKELTLSCRYEDEMNAGSYELTFSKDLKTLTGKYIIDGEEPDDANTVSATKQ